MIESGYRFVLPVLNMYTTADIFQVSVEAASSGVAFCMCQHIPNFFLRITFKNFYKLRREPCP